MRDIGSRAEKEVDQVLRTIKSIHLVQLSRFENRTVIYTNPRSLRKAGDQAALSSSTLLSTSGTALSKTSNSSFSSSNFNLFSASSAVKI
jgi:hypothetical protein